MIRKQTWILLAVFIVGLAATILIEKKPDILGIEATATPSATSQPRLVEGWQSSDITWIELQDSQESSLKVIQDAGGQWHLDTEDGDSVDAGAVEEARTQIAAAEVITTLDPGYDLKALGLDAEVRMITIRDKVARQAVIKIGQLTPTGNGYFVQVDQAAPAVVSKTSIDAILDRLQRNQLIQLETFPTTTSQP